MTVVDFESADGGVNVRQRRRGTVRQEEKG